MRRPIRVKSFCSFRDCFFFSVQPSHLCRHPSWERRQKSSSAYSRYSAALLTLVEGPSLSCEIREILICHKARYKFELTQPPRVLSFRTLTDGIEWLLYVETDNLSEANSKRKLNSGLEKLCISFEVEPVKMAITVGEF